MNHSSPFIFPIVDPSRQQPKSPKSPAGLENPLLKASALFAPRAPSLMIPEQRPAPMFHQPLKAVTNTPGPPPKASLSLNMKLNSVHQQLESSYETPVKALPTISQSTGSPSRSPSPFFNHTDEEPKQTTLAEGSSWVVAYGFTNERECQSLLSILKASGQIVATKSNSNWIAVQYPDELCAARATARQIVPVASVLCGISRATGPFVHELLARPAKPLESSSMVEPSSPTTSIALLKSSSLVEEDILAGYKDKPFATRGRVTESIDDVGSSFLVKAIYYFFGWKSNQA